MAESGPMVLIGRACAEPRTLPPIEPGLYTQDGRANEFARLANLELGFRARYLSWDKDPERRLARVFRLHRDAMQSEMNGDWQAADFLWMEFRNGLRALVRRDDVWAALATDELQGSDPDNTRRRVIDELGIDTHCAFYNAYAVAQAERPRQRSSFHLDRIQDLIAMRRAAEDNDQALIGPPLVQRISLRSTQKRWNDALRDCLYLERTYPERQDYQLLLAHTYSGLGLSQLVDSNKPAAGNANASTLQRCARSIEAIRTRHPQNPDLYVLLALIEHRRAIELARAERLSDALLAIQKAVTFGGAIPELMHTRAQLIEAMKRLQEQVRQLEDELRGGRNARLNARGERLRHHARTGFSPMNAYAKSDEARSISEALEFARVYRANHPEQATEPEATIAAPSALPIAQRPRPRSHEPLGLWLFSSQHRRIKLQALAATALVAFLSLATVQDTQHRQARDTAFAQMTQAASVGNQAMALDNAELFLSNPPVFGQDSRAPSVRSQYTRSLVGWFTEESTRATEAEAVERAARYRSLTGQQGVSLCASCCSPRASRRS